ncbi:MAG: transcriptional regulator [Candidatus Raymondbacteria bacterium RifOxyA12_full_50_37]|uniref:Transcriptional regulator n=1 Tax=Candidatus Raymondbacteria bacterium RIFOXYD12_FULL_49_13 TaxID=1817890 RepID=A0A1F7FEP1_UNCRA|nr:MAG: transcriptional regulator [Candidatus Raymondbacteria bacterium RifOxyB12_full_50_8]OGJ89783.1 MAG: transcriptional regulator [Candidatus Raymondbacteria bacterium RifOxyA12_full_50_37]OGJ91191.1 MAG: transcriptional regulator [Candidatus Raymondbacteria bacterium RIFOXYA2_FULL_49_16]OGJ97589.1 MAG: transcriptional regulator [Candidatus Raymondbacteria bacterium RIFOXYC2_FULL_50_21]OGK05061.1 MAG: transcriptional regulator [Candidatus Raymondbacteria bacterium RIFOXYD12_FULL_49_13]OGK0
MPSVMYKYEARANIIKAMAHPTRLLIIEKLVEREHCVCELTDFVGDDISTVSKHLSVLKNAGIVTDDKRGTMVFYHLKVPCILQFLGCIEKVIHDRAKEQLASVG